MSGDVPDAAIDEAAGRLALCQGLTEKQRASLLEDADTVYFKKQDTLVAKGETKREVYAILTGSAIVTAEDGRLLNVIGAGDTFGEIGFLCGFARTANVVAQSEGAMLVFTDAALDRVLKERPRVAATLLLNLSRELATRLTTMTEMALL